MKLGHPYSIRPVWWVHMGLLALCACALGMLFVQQGPSGWSLLWAPSDTLELADFLFKNNSLSRLAMAFLAGASLGFGALLLQQLTRNPLAADSTLAVSSGAQLSLLLVSIFMPQWLIWSSEIWALLGAGVGLLLVLGLSAHKGFLPTKMILAGLVVNLYFGAIAAVLWLFFSEEARSVMLWGSGSLVQDSWHDVWALSVRLLLCALVVVALLRPMTILGLGEEQAKNLGVPVRSIRVLGLGVAAYICASVVSMVGMLGFIGLAAAAVVQQLGLSKLSHRLLAAASIGGLLLLLTDAVLQWAQHRFGWQVGTGAVTAVIGAPLLLWLIFKALPQRSSHDLIKSGTPNVVPFRRGWVWLLLLGLTASMVMSLFVSQGVAGWHWTGWDEVLLGLRYPRLLAAMATGLMLAIAGVVLQRMSQNPMASPELLGISAGTAGGVLAAVWFSVSSVTMLWLIGMASGGLTLVFIMLINHKNGMMPEKILLTGMAVAALFDAFVRLFLASGDPRIQSVLVWLSGSTYQATPGLASGLMAAAVALFVLCLPMARWLQLLDLGPVMARSVGLRVFSVRMVLTVFSALLTAAATLLIGPLSFVGLLAPHLARALGFHRPLTQLFGAGLIGMWMMVLADWLGRYLVFPYELPAGLVATLLGGAYFLLMMRKI